MNSPPTSLRSYLSVTLAYWGFTLSDGALRMLVLLHFFQRGVGPLALASLFVVYEAAGIIANLGGGWLSVRFGLRRMIMAGIVLQICGLLGLAVMPQALSPAAAIIWIICAQGLCGIAKDFTKTASKTAVKLTGSHSRTGLFRWIAWFTGSKNAMKGAGFFAGALGLSVIGMQATLLVMAVMLGAMLSVVFRGAPGTLGQDRPSHSIKSLFTKTQAVNLLAAARIFLFGARDIWFVVGLPVFLAGAGWDFWAIGGFLAVWTVGYGAVQSLAPQLLPQDSKAQRWAAVWLAALGAGLMAAAALNGVDSLSAVLIVLTVFGLIFALSSSLHSFLILEATGTGKAAEDIGFYYAANAAGRLAGTAFSGLCFQAGGLAACLLGAALFFFICLLLTIRFLRL